MINDRFKNIFIEDIKHIENYIDSSSKLHKGIFPAVANGMLKNLNELKKHLNGLTKNEKPDFVAIFLLISKISKFTKNVISLLTEDLKILIRDIREFIDNYTFDFEDQFLELFVKTVKKNLSCDVKSEKFPIFIIDDRFKVEFNFKKSLTVLDNSIIVQSIDPENIAKESADYFKKIWIDNEDIKFSNKSINEYFEQYKKIIVIENKSYGDYVSIFELHKQIFIERQNELFWRECRPELMKRITINYTRAAIACFLESRVMTSDGYNMKLGTVRDNINDGVAIFSFNDKVDKYYGLIAFSREDQ